MLRMRMTIAIPSHLSDGALIAEVARCAHDERHATAQLIAHLAELDARRLYLSEGKSSLFTYCRDVLGLSNDAAYNRVEAARACRLFPAVLARLVDGSLTATSVRLLARHLTAENHRELLAAASHRSKREVEELIARRFPQPDTPSSVRKVPERTPSSTPIVPTRPAMEPAMGAPLMTIAAPAFVLMAPETEGPRPTVSTYRPTVKPLATDRYEIRFTASAATRDKLKVAQDLLRHAIPSGDVAALFDHALSALIEAHSRTKMAVVRRPAKARPVTASVRRVADDSRHVAAEVRRVVWVRDGGRCAFLAASGHRCGERAFLEYHHVVPYAVGGKATIANIQLRCRAHNAYEADVFFGAARRDRGADGTAERPENYAVSWDFSSVPERPPQSSGGIERG
jgi:HNH endonuclease